MNRLPSLQKDYSDFSDRDAALVQLPKGATKAQKTERERLHKLARDTGDWSEITSQGQTVTRYRFRQLTADEFLVLMAMRERNEPSPHVLSIAFRLALVDVEPLPDGVAVEHIDDPKLGRIALTSFFEGLGFLPGKAANVILELGGRVLARAREPDPL